MNGFAVIVVRTYFTTNIPNEILEAARIDGAGEWKTLVQIVIPLSTPILATIALLSGLAYWNDWINSLYYLVVRTDLFTIQNLLNRILSSTDFKKNAASNSAITAGIQVPSIGIRIAIASVHANCINKSRKANSRAAIFSGALRMVSNMIDSSAVLVPHQL